MTDIKKSRISQLICRRRLLVARRWCFVLVVACVVLFFFVYANLYCGTLGRVSAWMVFLFWLTTLFQVFYCKFFFPRVTPLMIKRWLQQRKKGNRHFQPDRKYVSIDDISPNLVWAVDSSENIGFFFYCRGFLFRGLREAYNHNRNSSTLRGGSTITQQTAKNCFLPHSRSLLRKVVEAYYVVLMEFLWGKKRIMECYLNIIEYGDGIFGCEAASQHYFHHSAATLTVDEAVLLAVTLPWPLYANPHKRTEAYDNRYKVIIERMRNSKPVDWSTPNEDLDPGKLEEGNRGLLFFIKWLVLQKYGRHCKANENDK